MSYWEQKSTEILVASIKNIELPKIIAFDKALKELKENQQCMSIMSSHVIELIQEHNFIFILTGQGYAGAKILKKLNCSFKVEVRILALEENGRTL